MNFGLAKAKDPTYEIERERLISEIRELMCKIEHWQTNMEQVGVMLGFLDEAVKAKQLQLARLAGL